MSPEKRTHLDDTHFVKIWMDVYNNNFTLDKIAAAFGISKARAASKATYLRQKGVKLPKLTRSPLIAVAVEDLNKIIEESK